MLSTIRLKSVVILHACHMRPDNGTAWSDQILSKNDKIDKILKSVRIGLLYILIKTILRYELKCAGLNQS